MKTSDFDYELPQELIAQTPVEPRDSSRLLVYHRDTGAVEHKIFRDVIDYLNPGDVLVINQTRVIPARLYGVKEGTGGAIEFLLLRRLNLTDWEVILKPGKKAKPGARFVFGNGELVAEILTISEDGGRTVRFFYEGVFEDVLDRLGQMPLPPYIHEKLEDKTRYQTVYAKVDGSAAAPTAGLHFTPELIESLRRAGHPTDEVTLHVGAGTFLPVKTDRVIDHRMHTEHFEFSVSTIRNLIAYDGRVTAVGTTSVRTLESLAALGYRIVRDGEPDPERVVGQWEIYDIPDGLDGRELLAALADYMERERLQKIKTSTRIMIMPGYRFRVVNSLITNFHQPKSTLLLLVSAFIGEDWRRAYRYALDNGFRFLSYGDSSLLIR